MLQKCLPIFLENGAGDTWLPWLQFLPVSTIYSCWKTFENISGFTLKKINKTSVLSGLSLNVLVDFQEDTS